MLYDDFMAFALADVDALIEAISNDPLLRERVVKALLHEDFLALPGIVARLGERIDRLTERMDASNDRMDALTQRMDTFAERMETLAEHMDTLTQRVDLLTLQGNQLVTLTASMNGRMGNIEGTLYEERYADRLASHLAHYYRAVRPLILGNVPELLAALDDGRINGPEWDDMILLDAAARVRPKVGGDEKVVVMELSLTVDVNDVERVARRADIIRRAGFVVDACVDGQRIEPLAQGRLADLSVISFVRGVAEAS